MKKLFRVIARSLASQSKNVRPSSHACGSGGGFDDGNERDVAAFEKHCDEISGKSQPCSQRIAEMRALYGLAIWEGVAISRVDRLARNANEQSKSR